MRWGRGPYTDTANVKEHDFGRLSWCHRVDDCFKIQTGDLKKYKTG